MFGQKPSLSETETLKDSNKNVCDIRIISCLCLVFIGQTIIKIWLNV